MNSLAELLQRAEGLANEVCGDPCIEKTLPEVLKDTKELHKRVTKPFTVPNESMGNARMMLAKSSIDLQLLTNKVKELDLSKSFKPIDKDDNTDVEGYLTDKSQSSIITVIEQTNKRIFKKVRNRRWHSLFEDWEEEKERLLIFSPDYNEEVCSTRDSPQTTLNCIQMLFAKKLIDYNNTQQKSENLLTTFTKMVEREMQDLEVIKMWKVLLHMAKETPTCLNLNAVKTRQMAPQFTQQALLFLETGFRENMTEEILKRKLLSITAIPNVYCRVKIFVEFKFESAQSLSDLLNVFKSRPLWPHVLYSLRCGDPDAAVQYLLDWGDPYPDLRETIHQQHKFRNIPDFLQKDLRYASNQMSLKLEYNNRVRECSDPFKKAVYAIVLACDPDDLHFQVMHSIEDCLWMLLTLRRKIKQFNIDDVKSLIRTKYGEHWLTECKIYFPMLILTGHFEMAIEYLTHIEEYEVHAIHMAIALNELSMLSITKNELNVLYSSQPDYHSPLCRLNVKRLIITHATRCEETNTIEALNYYYLLRRYKAIDGSNLMLKCISKFVLKNYNADVLNLIFGKSDPCNSRSIFDDRHFNKMELSSMLATKLIKRGEYESAIELYIVTGPLKEAMTLMCTLLAQKADMPQKNEGLRSLMNRLNLALTRNPSHLDIDESEKFKLFTQLWNFFDCYIGGIFCEALKFLDECQLIPNCCQQINFCLSRTKVLGADALIVMPKILSAVLEILLSKYRIENTAVKQNLRERAKALITYVATLEYRMPNEINKRLLQVELEMLN